MPALESRTGASPAALRDACERRGLVTDASGQLLLEQAVAGFAETLGALADTAPAAPRYLERPTQPQPNGWAVRACIPGAAAGPLAGTTFAAKDNMLVAGIPCSLGSDRRPALLARDTATAVARCLAAGATLQGKAQCEDFCQASQSFTSRPERVRNPVAPGHSAGGSSSGSAALVAAREVDFALGTDSGGSVRLPAAYCGVVGLKPTFGVVPFDHIMPLEPTLEHVGVITRSLALNERVFSALAPAHAAARRPMRRPLRIGLLQTQPLGAETDPRVQEQIEAASQRAVRSGAEVVPVDIPEHAQAAVVHLALYAFGVARTLATAGHPSSADIGHALARWMQDVQSLPIELRLLLAATDVLRDGVGERALCAAVTARPRLRAAYDRALQTVDVLLMPTSAQLPPPRPADTGDTLARALASLSGTEHTSAFNVTGHPALSVPVGAVDGLPVGGMLVASHHAEATLFLAARGVADPAWVPDAPLDPLN